jgi:CO/xanthine dehydrogenase FAD-binding subunit
MREVLMPDRLDDLWDILAEHPEGAFFAGGTDLLVKIRNGRLDPPCLIGLERLEPFKGVRVSGDEVFIGACTTHTTLLDHPVIGNDFPILARAISVLGSPPVRNMGTIGGNIATASPAGDTLPPLYAMGAEVEVLRKEGARRMGVGRFIRGPGETALLPGEIVSGIWLRKDQGFNLHHYEKVGQRKAQAIAIVSLAALLKVNRDLTVEAARFAWGSVGPTVVTSDDADGALVGKPLCAEALETVAALGRRAVSPIDDIRASAAYRRAVAGNLILRLSCYSNGANLYSSAQGSKT